MTSTNDARIKYVSRNIRRVADAMPIHSFVARQRVWWGLRRGEPELGLLSLLGDPSRDFLDVGANRGVYAFCALRHFRNVIAAEANPGMAADLRRIIRRNNQVLPVAMSDQVGETVLHIPTEDGHDVNTRCSVQADANPGLDLRTVTVPTTTIDELGLQQIAVIKIDVEGHELAVLRGGMGTLRRSGPTCIVESEERHNAGGVAQTFDFFDALGYNSYFLHRGALRKGADYDVTALQRPENAKSVGGGRSADYVNNFVFIHRENTTHLDRVRAAFSMP